MSLPVKQIGLNDITLEDIGELANLKTQIILSDDEHFVKKITKGTEIVKMLLAQGHKIYGVTTGIGSNSNVNVEPALFKELPYHLVLVNGCALGSLFSPKETRSIIAARLISLAKGNSGVSMELLDSLVCLLKHDILPRIPQEGSVGASGDLSHLSYIGAVICGFRTVDYMGQVMEASKALEIVSKQHFVQKLYYIIAWFIGWT